MTEMFKPKLARVIDGDSKPPTTVADCVTHTLRAEYRRIQIKEERPQFNEA